MSVIVGLGLDAAVAALPEERRGTAAKLIAYLSDPRKQVRARAMALVMQELAESISEITIR
ncbi:MAG: hypothetical protein FWD69_03640 [Polyangiaceae bacterium]|nr:hypothetical protein [Polyangiaceae bacterium]